MNTKFEIAITTTTEFKRGTVKSDFEGILESHEHTLILYPFTDNYKENLYNEFNVWRHNWELEDLQYKLVFGEHSINFIPVRKIDEYIMNGIMSIVS